MDMLSIVTGINTASGVNIFEESPAKKKLEKKSVSNKDKKDKLELLLGKFEKAHANVEKALKWLDKNENKLTRKLVKGSLEVHPIKDYGAIEIGVHEFRHVENGKEEIGTFKFLMIWHKKDNQWKISRVISYDH